MVELIEVVPQLRFVLGLPERKLFIRAYTYLIFLNKEATYNPCETSYLQFKQFTLSIELAVQQLLMIEISVNLPLHSCSSHFSSSYLILPGLYTRQEYEQFLITTIYIQLLFCRYSNGPHICIRYIPVQAMQRKKSYIRAQFSIKPPNNITKITHPKEKSPSNFSLQYFSAHSKNMKLIFLSPVSVYIVGDLVNNFRYVPEALQRMLSLNDP